MIQDIHPHRFDNTFDYNAAVREESYVFYFEGDALLLKRNNDALEIPKAKELGARCDDGIFLFKLNNTPCFLIWECTVPETEELSFHEIKFRNPFAQKEIDWASSVALQLRNWYLQHKYCGTCGSDTHTNSNERAISCSKCETSIYPTISPAIIVAILCGDKILLARGSRFPEGFYSLVAGYVDIGESIEDAVAREVKEEVGLNVNNIRYYGSQPWPFSGSMMLGFIAEAPKGQAIKIDNNEIIEANWYKLDELPDYPPQRSIAGEMINKFVLGQL